MGRKGRLIAGVVGLLLVLVIGAWLIVRSARAPEPKPQPAAAPLPVAASAAAPQESAAKPEETASASEKAEIEEVHTVLRQFVDDSRLGAGGCLFPPDDPGVFRSIAAHPLVVRALALARRSPATRAEAIRAISEAYNDYLTKFPLEQGTDEPRWRPSVAAPGGIGAYPYLLRQLDAVDTLPLLVQVFEKDQEVARAHYASLGGSPVSAHIGIGSYEVAVLAYACDAFLRECGRREDLLETCTPGQRAVLEQYGQFWEGLRRQVAEGLVGEEVMGVGIQQLQVMKFATDFCPAGGGAT